ncbi:MAG: hypothetical protein KKC39_08420 [Candidatus Omnitrophica bacterium]|nr:hypothetical protein [Candidatus Omnitrophota bacterium]MBU4302872.1 hypothetical protein [Candidatus Omnitrophota bacterium]MBU4468742.1 hypothetical protein [Candidatus Omnitrophota bacterium]MCG2708234.1 hypothetical protein [Candidatus Omnitrophota bacterium]
MDIFKNILLYFGIPTAIIGFIVWLIQQLISSKADNRSLKLQNDSLKEEKSQAIVTLQRTIDKYAIENAEFKEKLAKYTNRDIILARYEFIPSLGIFKHKSDNSSFCHKCLIEKTLESPLKSEMNGWRCSVCDSFYSNPNYRPPEQKPQKYNPFDF